MSHELYVMQYPDGSWVRRDDSTGPMSTGGYPSPVADLDKATRWKSVEKALKYMGVMKSERWTVHKLTMSTVKVEVSPADIAKATGDDEYIEFLRLKRKFGEAPEKCPFDVAWVGKCKQEPAVGEIYCPKHKEAKCFECGGQATRDCDHTSQFVCGTPMCDQHRHH